MKAIKIPIDNWEVTLDRNGVGTFLSLETKINETVIRHVRQATKNKQDHINLKAFANDLKQIKSQMKEKLLNQAIKKRKIPYDNTWNYNIDIFNTSAKSFKTEELIRNLLVAMWNDPRSNVFLRSATNFKPEILLFPMDIEEQIKIYNKFYKLHQDDFYFQFDKAK